MKVCAFVLQQNILLIFQFKCLSIYLSFYLSILRLYKTLCSPTVRTLVYIQQSNTQYTAYIQRTAYRQSCTVRSAMETVQCENIDGTVHVYRAKYSIICSAYCWFIVHLGGSYVISLKQTVIVQTYLQATLLVKYGMFNLQRIVCHVQFTTYNLPLFSNQGQIRNPY